MNGTTRHGHTSGQGAWGGRFAATTNTSGYADFVPTTASSTDWSLSNDAYSFVEDLLAEESGKAKHVNPAKVRPPSTRTKATQSQGATRSDDDTDAGTDAIAELGSAETSSDAGIASDAESDPDAATGSYAEMSSDAESSYAETSSGMSSEDDWTPSIPSPKRRRAAPNGDRSHKSTALPVFGSDRSSSPNLSLVQALPRRPPRLKSNIASGLSLDVEDAQEAILGLRAVYGIGRDFLNVCTAADEPASRAELRKVLSLGIIRDVEHEEVVIWLQSLDHDEEEAVSLLSFDTPPVISAHGDLAEYNGAQHDDRMLDEDAPVIVTIQAQQGLLLASCTTTYLFDRHPATPKLLAVLERIVAGLLRITADMSVDGPHLINALGLGDLAFVAFYAVDLIQRFAPSTSFRVLDSDTHAGQILGIRAFVAVDYGGHSHTIGIDEVLVVGARSSRRLGHHPVAQIISGYRSTLQSREWVLAPMKASRRDRNVFCRRTPGLTGKNNSAQLPQPDAPHFAETVAKVDMQLQQLEVLGFHPVDISVMCIAYRQYGYGYAKLLPFAQHTIASVLCEHTSLKWHEVVPWVAEHSQRYSFSEAQKMSRVQLWQAYKCRPKQYVDHYDREPFLRARDATAYLFGVTPKEVMIYAQRGPGSAAPPTIVGPSGEELSRIGRGDIDIIFGTFQGLFWLFSGKCTPTATLMKDETKDLTKLFRKIVTTFLDADGQYVGKRFSWRYTRNMTLGIAALDAVAAALPQLNLGPGDWEGWTDLLTRPSTGHDDERQQVVERLAHILQPDLPGCVLDTDKLGRLPDILRARQYRQDNGLDTASDVVWTVEEIDHLALCLFIMRVRVPTVTDVPQFKMPTHTWYFLGKRFPKRTQNAILQAVLGHRFVLAAAYTAIVEKCERDGYGWMGLSPVHEKLLRDTPFADERADEVVGNAEDQDS